MKQIVAGIKEVRHLLSSTTFMLVLLESLVVFVFTVFILQLFVIPWIMAVPVWLLVFLVRLRKKMRAATLVVVEARTPALFEQLRTAADNLQMENPVVEALQQDVVRNLRRVEVADYVPFGKVSRNLMFLIILSAALIVSAQYKATLFDSRQLISETRSLGGSVAPIDTDLPLPEDDSSIYGNKSVIALGTQELALTLTPLSTDLNFNKIKPPSQQQFSENVPRQILATRERSFEEKIPKEQQQIIKNYFSQIAKG